MDFVLYALAGASVGFAVGLTGVGGGSLMTPLLLLFGFPAPVAVGTDLMYAAVTKAGGVYLHYRNNTIRLRIVALLAIGSLPASLLTVWLLRRFFVSAEAYSSILTSSLGFMLIVTSLVLMFKQRLHRQTEGTPGRWQSWATRHALWLTITMGVFLGVCVTLSSVGAGAFGAAILLLLYPLLPSIHIIGTDLAHAVPLTLIAGIGHLLLGNVDLLLLACLLTGSLPAIYLGTRLGSRLPEPVIRPLLASLLLLLGAKYAFF